MQNFFNNFSKNFKVLLAVGFGIAMILGIVNLDNFLPPDIPDDNSLVEVEFIVQGKDNQPIEGAKIQFIFKGPPEIRFTNTDGYVRINIPSRDDIDITLSKEGFETINKTINLKADPSRTRTFILEQKKNSKPNVIDDGGATGGGSGGTTKIDNFHDFMVGVWEAKVQQEYFEGTGITTTTRIRYNQDGTYTGSQTVMLSGGIPVTTKLQGTWEVTEISKNRFLLTVRRKENPFLPENYEFEVIDNQTINNANLDYQAFKVDKN